MTAAHPRRAARAAGLSLAVATLLSAAPARAQHDHHHGDRPAPADEPDERPFEVGLAVIGARYDQALYSGDYAGVGLAVGWHRGRFAARATVPAYHVRKNGAAVDGLGDAVVGADLSVAADGPHSGGVSVAFTLPTGDRLTGLGMGHPMFMPALWVAYDRGRASVGASLGVCTALGGDDGHHAHGAWPIVEPMSASEAMASARAEVVVASRVRAGARVLIAVPFADEPTRVVAGVGGRWRGARTETGAELQAGLAGDPFTVRALVTSALRF